MDMRFGTWNVRSLYTAGTLMTVSREVSRYKVNLVGEQEVSWEGSGTVQAGEYAFFKERGMRTMNWVQGFFVHKRIISPVKEVEFINGRMSYIILRGR
jgi:hypothetical protein